MRAWPPIRRVTQRTSASCGFSIVPATCFSWPRNHRDGTRTPPPHTPRLSFAVHEAPSFPRSSIEPSKTTSVRQSLPWSKLSNPCAGVATRAYGCTAAAPRLDGPRRSVSSGSRHSRHSSQSCSRYFQSELDTAKGDRPRDASHCRRHVILTVGFWKCIGASRGLSPIRQPNRGYLKVHCRDGIAIAAVRQNAGDILSTGRREEPRRRKRKRALGRWLGRRQHWHS